MTTSRPKRPAPRAPESPQAPLWNDSEDGWPLRQAIISAYYRRRNAASMATIFAQIADEVPGFEFLQKPDNEGPRLIFNRLCDEGILAPRIGPSQGEEEGAEVWYPQAWSHQEPAAEGDKEAQERQVREAFAPFHAAGKAAFQAFKDRVASPESPPTKRPPRIILTIDPGDATAEELTDLFLAISAYHQALGGSGLEIGPFPPAQA